MNKNDGKQFDGEIPRLKWRRRRWRRVAMPMIMMGWGEDSCCQVEIKIVGIFVDWEFGHGE